MPTSSCAFCRPEIGREALWESEHYRILADEYPRCAGHVLLVTREHFPSQMHAPAAWLAEFEAAQERMQRFLQDVFGRATFWENGGKRQEVPHAHLHGVPFDPGVETGWPGRRVLRRVEGWPEVREERERRGYYFYLETGTGRYVFRRDGWELKWVRLQLYRQVLAQTEARANLRRGRLVRGGPEMVARTGELWRKWSGRDVEDAAPVEPRTPHALWGVER